MFCVFFFCVGHILSTSVKQKTIFDHVFVGITILLKSVLKIDSS